jgi:transcription elongation factor Elf1
VQPSVEEDVIERPHLDRRPDYGNVIHVACRRCGAATLLDPTRMEKQKVGVFLLCPQCGRRFLVRRTDVGRPIPDAEVASLYTTEVSEPVAPRWSRLRKRS